MKKIILTLLAFASTTGLVSAQTIAILDQGHNTRSIYETPADHRFIKQYCFSPVSTGTQNQGGSEYLVSASYCPNGQQFDEDTYYAARLPRTFQTVTSSGQSQTFTVGYIDSHGNSVSSAAYAFSQTGIYQHVQIFGAAQRVFQGPAYYYTKVDTVVDALTYLDTNVAGDPSKELHAINLSFAGPKTVNGVVVESDACDDDIGQEVINSLYEKGVVVVAGMLNDDINSSANTWPQCLLNVVNVASSSATGSPGNGVGNGLNGIDFFAIGTATSPSSTGNSMAAPRVATLYAILGKRFPYSSIDERSAAINAASTLMHSYKGTTKRFVKKEDIPGAYAYLLTLYPEYTPEELAEMGLLYANNYEHGTLYGEIEDNHSFEIDFSVFATATSQSQSLTDGTNSAIFQAITANQNTLGEVRDVVLKFTGAFDPGGSRSFRIRVNGNIIATIGNYYSVDEEENISFTIHRDHFNNGSNTISIEPDVYADLWGIKGITAGLTPIVPLTVGQTNTNVFGYYDGYNRYTGMRASFDLTSVTNDYSLSMVGWDIDVADETAVFVNETRVGFLNVGESSAYSLSNTFLLPKSLLRTGENNIELVQRTADSSWISESDRKWAVKDIRVEVANPNLKVLNLKILDPTIYTDEPFDAEIKIQNVGAGGADSSTVTFYLSSNEGGTQNVTQLGTATVAATAVNQTRTVTKTLESPLVNQGYYFSACVEVVANESNGNDNCSTVIPFKKVFNVAPIMLLLQE